MNKVLTAWVSALRTPAGAITSLLLVASGTCIGVLQPRLAQASHLLGNDQDAYAVPQPDQLYVFSLGYHAAVADLLFGNTLVEAGIHFAEKRVMLHLGDYFKAIVRLEPRYRDVYLYADSMLNLSTVEMPPENLVITREILDGGLKLFPDDADLWMNAGLFLAYMAPPRLPAGQDPNEWKQAGARMMQHACDVWPRGRTLPSACVSSAGLLQRTGETDAAITSLRHMLAVTDDPEARAQAFAMLSRLAGEQLALREQSRISLLQQRQVADMPGLSPTQYQLLSPETNPQDCWGSRLPPERVECASSFAFLAGVEEAAQ